MSSPIVVSVPDQQLREALHGTPNAEIVMWDMEGAPPRPSIDLVVAPYMDGPGILANIDRVTTQLVQWQSIGFDGVKEVIPAGVRFANAATVHETATAELAVGITIAAQRDFGGAVRNQLRGVWENDTRRGLADSRVLLVGYGGVSKAIEARLAPFEVEITRVASSARTESNLAGESVSVHAIDDLAELVAVADIVMIGLPLTDSTRQLFDAQLLARMRDDALLVNVGRGGIVDTDALVAELTSGRLRAALDVVDPEPLPSDHPLWQLDNVFITPHNGGDSAAMLPRVVKLITRQIEHLAAGRDPENVVLE